MAPDLLPKPTPRPKATVVVVLESLWDLIILLVVLGAIVASICWLAGD